MTELDLSNRFDGRTALITGSSQGLGYAIAELMIERGLSKLIVHGRDRAKGEEAAKKLSDLGCEAHFIPADLSDIDQVQALAESAFEKVGTIDHLVNAAAYTGRGTILNETVDRFDLMMNVNVRAPFFLTQAVTRRLVAEQRPGSIVNILSVVSQGGPSILTAYCASKAALSVMTKNVAFSLLANKIRVNGLNIGWMDTPGEDAVQKKWHGAPDNWLAEVEAEQPVGRLVKPQEVARHAAFLLSNESGMVTGAVYELDQQVIGAMETGVHPTGPMVWPEAR